MAGTGAVGGGRLYIVATPLGNLEDLSARALRVLRDVSLIACEDTRRTGRLLAAHGIVTRTTSYFEHNERWKGARILEAVSHGRDVALVSDAGTPAISDPGFRLVRDAHAAGLAVIPVPGPNAAVAALSASGLPSDRFLFVGFLPPRTGARRRALEELRERRETLVFYEAPTRLLEALDDLEAVLGDREAFLAREATKLHEEYRRARLGELRAELGGRASLRGEVTLVVAGASQVVATGDVAEPPEVLVARLMAEGQARRAAVKEVARRTGLPARELYRRVLPGASATDTAETEAGEGAGVGEGEADPDAPASTNR